MSDDELWDYSNFWLFIARCRIFCQHWLAPVFFCVLRMLRSLSYIVISFTARLIFNPYVGIQRLVKKYQSRLEYVRQAKFVQGLVCGQTCNTMLCILKFMYVYTNFEFLKYWADCIDVKLVHFALLVDSLFFILFYHYEALKTGQIVESGNILLFCFFYTLMLGNFYTAFYEAIEQFLVNFAENQMLAHLGAQLCVGCVSNIIKLHFCRKTLRTSPNQPNQHLQLQKWFVLFPFIQVLGDLLVQRTIVFILNSFGFMLLVDNAARMSFWLSISDVWSNILHKILWGCLNHINTFNVYLNDNIKYRKLEKFIANGIMWLCFFSLCMIWLSCNQNFNYSTIFNWKHVTFLITLCVLKYVDNRSRNIPIPDLHLESDSDISDDDVPLAALQRRAGGARAARTQSPGRPQAVQAVAQPPSPAAQVVPQAVRKSARVIWPFPLSRMLGARKDAIQKNDEKKTYEIGDKIYVKFENKTKQTRTRGETKFLWYGAVYLGSDDSAHTFEVLMHWTDATPHEKYTLPWGTATTYDHN